MARSPSSSDDPVALVTGASRGIGRAVAITLARAGYRIAATARDRAALDELCRTLGGERRAIGIAADLHEATAPDRILDRVRAAFGPPDVIVNNAGIAPSDRFEDSGDAMLDAVLDLHVRAPFRLLRTALPGLRARPRSCAVQIASTAGLRGFPFTAAYAAGKHAMVGLSRALAAEFRGREPRVYALCPGFVDTAITRDAAAALAARSGKPIEATLAAFGAMNRIGRMHQPEEVAQAVRQLVEEQPEGCVFELDRDPPGFLESEGLR
jgi:NAD(P)-dependent dehydrogenase (short-subunit alcohol dehydrogenase family)